MKSPRLEALGGAEINEAKKQLATEATAMLHGREAALRATGAARETFVKLKQANHRILQPLVVS